jgi:hypothetical protein
MITFRKKTKGGQETINPSGSISTALSLFKTYTDSLKKLSVSQRTNLDADLMSFIRTQKTAYTAKEFFEEIQKWNKNNKNILVLPALIFKNDGSLDLSSIHLEAPAPAQAPAPTPTTNKTSSPAPASKKAESPAPAQAPAPAPAPTPAPAPASVSKKAESPAPAPKSSPKSSPVPAPKKTESPAPAPAPATKKTYYPNFRRLYNLIENPKSSDLAHVTNSINAIIKENYNLNLKNKRILYVSNGSITNIDTFISRLTPIFSKYFPSLLDQLKKIRGTPAQAPVSKKAEAPAPEPALVSKKAESPAPAQALASKKAESPAPAPVSKKADAPAPAPAIKAVPPKTVKKGGIRLKKSKTSKRSRKH